MKSIGALLLSVSLAFPMCVAGTSALAGKKFQAPLGGCKRTKKKKKKSSGSSSSSQSSKSNRTVQPDGGGDEEVFVTFFDTARQ